MKKYKLSPVQQELLRLHNLNRKATLNKELITQQGPKQRKTGIKISEKLYVWAWLLVGYILGYCVASVFAAF